MADDNPPSSPPLPKRGAYNIDFDNLDDSINPFVSNTAMGSSPPLRAAPPVNYDDLDDIVDPFKPRAGLSNSPPSGTIAGPPPSLNGPNDIEDPFKSKSKVASSPPGSPRVIPQSNSPKDAGFNPDTYEGPTAEGDLKGTDETPGEGQSKAEVTPKKKKGLKKPKIQSKFRPPKNFKKPQQEDSGDIQIFMPGVEDNAMSPAQSEPKSPLEVEPKADERPADIMEQPVTEGGRLSEPPSNLPDVVTVNESSKKSSKGSDSTEDAPKDAAPDALASSVGSDQPFMDRGEVDEQEQDNEGFALAPEAIHSEDADLMDRSDLKEYKKSQGPDDSLLSRFDPLTQDGQEKSSRSSTSPKEHGSSHRSEDEAVKPDPLSDSGRHPAARALEAAAADAATVKVPEKKNETEDGPYFDAYDYPPAASKKPSAMDGDQATKDENPKGTVVQLVQVLRYSQSDWNKLKQELELNFQTSLLNKEREWSLLLGDRDKKLSALDDANSKLRHTNEDMRMVVAEFEKTISQLQADKEKSRSDSSQSLQTVENERDQALEDLSSVETAFSDLHRRYEKSKTIIEGFKRNEEQLKLCVADLQEKVKRSESKLQALKSQAEEKLDRANEDIEKVKKTSKQDICRLEAAVKKAELRITGLERSIQTKEKENSELTAICDELIAKVGS